MNDQPDKAAPQTLPIRKVLGTGHFRLVLIAVIISALGLLLSGGILIRHHEALNIQLASRTIAYAVEPALVFGDRESADQAVSSVSTVSSIERALVQDIDGNVLARWDRQDGNGGSAQDAINSLIWPSPMQTAVAYEGESIGTVVVYGNANALLKFALAGLSIAVFCVGLTLVAAHILARKLNDLVSRPLENLANLADEVSRHRDFSRRMPPYQISEVNRLTTGFNSLLGELQGWQESVSDEKSLLEFQIEHDPLTNLGNRIRFEKVLVEMIERANIRGEHFSVLFIDLDRFKSINDSYGHPTGDKILGEFAKRLLNNIRGNDRVFRLGGDEFAILLDPAQERLQAHQIAARIHAAMLPPIILASGERIPLSASIGIANYPEDGSNSEQLLQHADAEMYQDKMRGEDVAQ